MKYLLIIPLLCVSVSLFAQGYGEKKSFEKEEVTKDKEDIILPKDDKDNVCYTSVIEVPKTLKNDLYIRSNEWFAKTFKSANDVIQLNDKETGKIIGKGSTKVSTKIWGTISFTYITFTITVEIKDNKYRCTIDNINVDKMGEFNNEFHIYRFCQQN